MLTMTKIRNVTKKIGRKSQYPNGSKIMYIFIPKSTPEHDFEKLAADQIDRVLDVFRLPNFKKYGPNVAKQQHLF